MPVVIRDFSVESNGQNEPPPAEASDASPAPARPLSGPEIARMMKVVHQRAGRLHAD